MLEEDHYYPFGLTLNTTETQTGVDPQPYKYQGIELEKHFGLEMYETPNRGLDPQLGIFRQVDPMAELTYAISPFASMNNNPVLNIDPLGLVAGDYYNGKGEHLGNDGKDDDKAYVADSKTVTENKDGTTTTTFDNAKELPITNTELRQQAATVYGESSAYKMSKVTDDLKKEMFSIASVHLNNKTAYGANSDKAKEFLALTPDEVNKSAFKTTATAAVINAQTGGFDYSYGASMWDGKEQSLFPANNNEKSVKYKSQSFELHMNTMGWNISDDHFNSWKSNVGSSFVAPQQKAAPANFGSYKNQGLMRLKSTAGYGETIFWKVQ